MNSRDIARNAEDAEASDNATYQGPKILALSVSQTHSPASVAGVCWKEDENVEEEAPDNALPVPRP